MFFQPHIALNNAMACRVFRGIRLGLIQDVDGNAKKPATNLNLLRLSRGSHSSKPSGEGSHVTVEITKNMEYTGP